MKRRIMEALLLSGVLGCMIGCGKLPMTGGLSTEHDPVKIVVWNYYTGAQLEEFNKLVDEFNTSEGEKQGIHVDAMSQGSIADLKAGVNAAANKEVGADRLPNICASYTDTAYQLDNMGLLEDIGQYVTEDEKAEYIDSYLKEGDLSGNGELKIFPVAKATEIFMLNRTDWDKFAEATGAELSELSTIEGVTKIAGQYYEWTDGQTEAEDDGKAFFGRDAIANYMFIGARQLGHDIISRTEDGSYSIDFPEDVAQKLWDNYYVPFVHGYFSAMGKFRSDDVKTGNAICFVGSSSSASFFPKEVILSDTEKYPIEVSVLKTPQFAQGEDYAVQQGAGMAILKASEEEVKASVEFLKWFTRKENNIRFSMSSGYLPVKKDANKMEEVESVEEMNADVAAALEVALDTVNTSNLYTNVGGDTSIRNILETALSDKAAADSESIHQKMAEGMSREEAVAVYDTDENFKTWYKALYSELEQAAVVTEN